MNRIKLLVAVLAVILIVSVTANVYLLTQSQDTANKTKIGMVDVLLQIQDKADDELEVIGNSLIYASEQLSNTGLTGTQADAILSALAANSSFIIDAGTQNMNRIMVAVQPEEYSSTIGQDVGKQKWLNTNPDSAITPMLSPVIPLIENCSGVSMAAPVFDSNREMIGVVSVIFDPQALLSSSISTITTDTQYEFTVMQLDGLLMFDSMSSSVGTNLFDTATNEQILMTGYEIVQNEAGYSTYTISNNQEKQCYWTTISQYGQEWRLIVHHFI